LAERYNVKEAGVVLGGAAAVTSRIGVGTGAVAAGARLPVVTAALGASMHAAYGPRFILGMGRGQRQLYRGLGFLGGGEVSYAQLLDCARIIRRLWSGETIDYDGPVGRFEGLRLTDIPDTHPQIWFAHLGGPMACKVAADPVFDGVLLQDLLNFSATANAVRQMREECERIGRDPASLRICQCVITAPELDEIETRELAHARAVASLEYQGVGEMLSRLNGWDPEVMQSLRAHPKVAAGGMAADMNLHRSQMLDLTSLLPDSWMREAAAFGSVKECVTTLQAFRDAGADEIAVYGSTPPQNAGLIEAWRIHSQRPVGPS
jgi:probable F420-dependent oxidoreductase